MAIKSTAIILEKSAYDEKFYHHKRLFMVKNNYFSTNSEITSLTGIKESAQP